MLSCFQRVNKEKTTCIRRQIFNTIVEHFFQFAFKTFQEVTPVTARRTQRSSLFNGLFKIRWRLRLLRWNLLKLYIFISEQVYTIAMCSWKLEPNSNQYNHGAAWQRVQRVDLSLIYTRHDFRFGTDEIWTTC